MSPELVAALAALGCGVGGAIVPSLIARLPEPAPEPDEELGDEPDHERDDESGEDPKELYTDIAARPGLRLRAVLLAALTGGLIGYALGADWSLLVVLPLVPIGVALAVIDWRTRLLPTSVIGPSYVAAAALVLICFAITRDTDDLVRAGLGWLISGGLFFVLWFIHPRGLGYGDVRLSGVLGIVLGQLGWGPLLVGVYGGFLLGGVGGGLLTVLRLVDRRALPFGPFMLVGALIGILTGPTVWSHLVTG